MPNINHTVLLQFQPQVTQAQLDEVFATLGELQHTIPSILDYTHGPNNSPENLNHDFTHGFSMIFEDAQARDDYLPHPAHEAFKDFAITLIQNVLVFDYDC